MLCLFLLLLLPSTIFTNFLSRVRLARVTTLTLVLLGFSLVTFRSDPFQAFALAADVPAGMVRVKVEVPAGMRTGELSQDRYLNLPPDFTIAVYARIPQARFMAVAPNGDLLVSQPSRGKVLLVRPDGFNAPRITDFASGLRSPHDIVFHTINNTTYVYITETNQINRYIYNRGDDTAHDREVIISGLPDASNPELRGAYGHPLKNIALDSNHKLYVAIASTCNACPEDTRSDPKRGAIYQYEADGKNRRLFAEGLRNAEGLAFVPGTNDLWVVVNNRDNIRVADPASPDYKKIIPAYVDNHPAEEFTRVREGGNYGWPFCNPVHETPAGYDNMPFERDVELNEGGQVDCEKMDRINKGIQAHSAPLGLTFLQDTAFAAPWREGAITALHGSWNRTTKTGYKLAYFPWNRETRQPGGQVDLVTGWYEERTQAVWGRVVDVAVDPTGSLLISDDYSGTLYRMTYHPPAGQPISFAEPAFERVWQRTDPLVTAGQSARSYLWGPQPFTGNLVEEYAEGRDGKRLVQYFDKSRMELTDPAGNQDDPFYVTNGLLVNELISGRMQVGHTRFVARQAANIGVAGDIDDASGPTYRTFGGLTGPVANAGGGPVKQALARSGQMREAAPEFGKYNSTYARYEPLTGHNIARPFWDYLNTSGPVQTRSGQMVPGRLFEPVFYATGLPVTEAYWTSVKVGGQVKDVLVQAFERRVLTYTPSNPPGFQVEMGNVGRHYYLWRYGPQ